MSLILVHDVETTGFSEKSDYVTEYAAIAFDTEVKQPVGFLSVLIDNGEKIPQKITEITGIDNSLLSKYGVTKEVAVKRILKFYSRFNIDYIMAHNEPFDRKFTKELLNGFEPVVKRICTQRDLDHKAVNNKLTTLSEHYKINHGFAHRAMTDVMACLGVAIAAGLYDLLQEPEDKKFEIRIKLPFDPENFDSNNKKARDLGFYWAGNTNTKHHYAQVKQSNLNEKLEVIKQTRFKLIEVVEVK